ncbi:hypothetical protein DAEQUDRAFT_254530 [Daedalea quercina L-15889]|uniref:Uncharacterized protein n=1 Tax=Daedalea quercina L-15889 TaxID=1314783 RepID=A0A165QI54_9APHY|nr:hypothetical protein DAEQUDRAFT_254530 [Daedalea quercina L-15889]
MSQFTVSEGELVALFTASIVYGIHAVAFAARMRIWLRRSRRTEPEAVRWPWVFIAISLLALGTLHVSLICLHNIEAFLSYHGPNGPEGDFKRLWNWINGLRVRICSDIIYAD